MSMSRMSSTFGVAAVIGAMAVVVSAQQNPAPSTAPAPASAQAPAAPSGNAENGKKLFEQHGCADCHGLYGQGAPTSGPRVGPNPLQLAALIRYVRAPRVQMPPYTAKVLPDQSLVDIRAFLAALPKPAGVAVLAP